MSYSAPASSPARALTSRCVPRLRLCQSVSRKAWYAVWRKHALADDMARKHFVLVLGMIIYYFSKAECVHAREGLVLPCASHSGEITLSGSRRLRSTLAAVSVYFTHAVVTVAKYLELVETSPITGAVQVRFRGRWVTLDCCRSQHQHTVCKLC